MRTLRPGSVLMEYVVLLVGMVVLVEGVALATYDYQGRGSFGKTVQPVVYLFQRVVTAVSLPVP